VQHLAQLRTLRTQQAQALARATVRASNLVTPVTPTPTPTNGVSSQLTFPFSDPGADSFTTRLVGGRHVLTLFASHAELQVLSPARAQIFGAHIDPTGAASQLYFEASDVPYRGQAATLAVLLTLRTNAITLTPAAQAAVAQKISTPQGLARMGAFGVQSGALSLSEGQSVATIPAGAMRSAEIDVRWYTASGEELPGGYPSPVSGWKQTDYLKRYGLTPPPIPQVPQTGTAYAYNPALPYGWSWGTCRPAGWPIDGPRVATADASLAIVAPTIATAIELLRARNPLFADIPNVVEEATAIIEAIAFKEGGGRLWLPQNGFDVRPRITEGAGPRVRIDEGPHTRTYKWHKVTAWHRPDTQDIIVSPIGPFQMTVDTFRGEYDRRVRDGTFVGPEHAVGKYATSWLWDAPVEYQVLLPALKLIEECYAPTAPGVLGGRLFPPIYRAFACYAINALNSVGRAFIAQAVLAVSRLPADASDEAVHIACKNVWDSGTGEPGTWAHFRGFGAKHWNMLESLVRKLGTSGKSLPTTHPTLFRTYPLGLPAPKTRRAQ
jgi:hypothetical protein